MLTTACVARCRHYIPIDVTYNKLGLYEDLHWFDENINLDVIRKRLQTFIGWVAKIYYLQLLGASQGTLCCWSWLHLQSLAATPFKELTSGRRPDQNMMENILYRPHLVEKR
jgi:hypothetical protein